MVAGYILPTPCSLCGLKGMRDFLTHNKNGLSEKHNETMKVKIDYETDTI